MRPMTTTAEAPAVETGMVKATAMEPPVMKEPKPAPNPDRNAVRVIRE